MQEDNYILTGSHPPTKLKPQEWWRYNPGWVDVSEPDHGFVPLPQHSQPTYEVHYLWVLKPGDGTDEGSSRLIIGIEAGDADKLKAFLALYGISGLSQEQLNGMLGMGHPTLSAHFIDELPPKDGQVPEGYGEAFCGGELYFDQETHDWKINNHSGRHSSQPRDDWPAVMAHVAERLGKSLNLHLTVGDIKTK